MGKAGDSRDIGNHRCEERAVFTLCLKRDESRGCTGGKVLHRAFTRIQNYVAPFSKRVRA